MNGCNECVGSGIITKEEKNKTKIPSLSRSYRKGDYGEALRGATCIVC